MNVLGLATVSAAMTLADGSFLERRPNKVFDYGLDSGATSKREQTSDELEKARLLRKKQQARKKKRGY